MAGNDEITRRMNGRIDDASKVMSGNAVKLGEGG
jgi:hypothetical protein